MAERPTRSWSLGRNYWLKADRREVFPDDPGNGTPLMVYGPFGYSATLWAAEGEGELTQNSTWETKEIPASVMRQLDRVRDEAVAWVGC